MLGVMSGGDCLFGNALEYKGGNSALCDAPNCGVEMGACREEGNVGRAFETGGMTKWGCCDELGMLGKGGARGALLTISFEANPERPPEPGLRGGGTFSGGRA